MHYSAWRSNFHTGIFTGSGITRTQTYIKLSNGNGDIGKSRKLVLRFVVALSHDGASPVKYKNRESERQNPTYLGLDRLTEILHFAPKTLSDT